MKVDFLSGSAFTNHCFHAPCRPPPTLLQFCSPEIIYLARQASVLPYSISTPFFTARPLWLIHTPVLTADSNVLCPLHQKTCKKEKQQHLLLIASYGVFWQITNNLCCERSGRLYAFKAATSPTVEVRWYSKTMSPLLRAGNSVTAQKEIDSFWQGGNLVTQLCPIIKVYIIHSILYIIFIILILDVQIRMVCWWIN